MAKRLVVVAAVAVLSCASSALAQCACGVAETVYAPAVSTYTVSYAPALTPTVTYYPSTVAPTVAYYPPATTTYYPAATTAYYAPTVAYYPAATTAYYAPRVTYYAAAPTVAYSPVVGSYTTYYGAPVAGPREVVGSSMYGTPKVYVSGEPVRNALRAITP